jgi:hypothetical protein
MNCSKGSVSLSVVVEGWNVFRSLRMVGPQDTSNDYPRPVLRLPLTLLRLGQPQAALSWLTGLGFIAL